MQSEANDSAVPIFSDTYKLKSLMKEPNCYQNPNKPYCIDLILTKKPQSLSDFHKVTSTVMKAFFKKEVTYTDYKCFENDRFPTDLSSYQGRQL